jgi:hypothetical protein
MAMLALALLAAAASHTPERRCGWLVNPTPANWSLIDRDGEWELGAQGGWQAPGLDEMPDMTVRGWVETNGFYGHGCACLGVATDRRSRRVTRVFSARPVPLRVCRADRHLRRF